MIAILDKVLAPLTSVVTGWSERKTAKLEGKLALEKAKWNLKTARIEAKTQELLIENTRDFDYDIQVLKNRNNTIADEIIICLWIAVFAAHFIPQTQNYMKLGWEAMGYVSPPWWFEFGMVGILVSTLGLMRVLKLWASMFGRKVNGKDECTHTTHTNHASRPETKSISQ